MIEVLIKKLREKAKEKVCRIGFPEYDDERVKNAAEYLKKEGILEPVLVTPETICEDNVNKFAEIIYEKKKIRGMTYEEAQNIVRDPLYYTGFMAKFSEVDGVVAGAVYTTSSVARMAINCLDIDESLKIVTSCFIMGIPNCEYGEKGVFVFADCGIIPVPSAEQLSKIAILAGRFSWDILGFEPRIAFLSFSTKGSASGRWIDKIREAVELTKSKTDEFLVDGELQADAALVEDIARRKLKDSPVAGCANVLIFPNLEAGNICYKLTERLAKAKAIGPIILGTKQPISDLSRGCSTEDIIDVAVVTAVRAQMLK